MAGAINWTAQVLAVTRFGLAGLLQRKGSVGAAVFGVAGVVAVLVGVLSIAAGFKHAITASGDPAGAIILRAGAEGEMASGLSLDQTRIIADAPGVARSPQGALASAELFVIVNLPKRSTGTDANVPFRGVESAAFQVRDNLKLVQGRRFEPGKNEIVVGVGAAKEFAGLDVGNTLRIGKYEWPVVGTFSAGGGSAESEIWTDTKMLQAAYDRGPSYQSVHVKLTSPDAFPQFKDSLTADPRVTVKVLRQTEYYEEQSTAVTRLITTLGYLVALLMAVGAVFAALNTMYSSVAVRSREIATLRALGFGSGAVVVSVMLEALLLALAGGILGAAVAYLAFDNLQTATMNWQSFSQITFAFRVTPELLVRGIIWATGIGLVGGLLPALRAAHLPVAAALREL